MAMHSIIPASSAHIWGPANGCRAWAGMNAVLPAEDDSERAREGSAAHDLCAEILENAAQGPHCIRPYESYTGEINEKYGIVYTDEIIQAVRVYTEFCIKLMRSCRVSGGKWLGIEELLTVPSVHPENFGTCDFFVYSRIKNEIHVADFKYGFAPVNAFENWQCLNYLAGIIDKFQIDGYADQKITAFIHVVQPRAFKPAGSIDTWKFRLHRARSYVNRLRQGAKESLSSGAQCRTGKHCRYCRVRYGCIAANQAAMDLYETASAPNMMVNPESLGLQLSLVTRAYKQLSYVKEGLEQEIESMLRSGKGISRYEMVSQNGAAKWTVDTETVIALGQSMGLELGKTSTATPRQAIEAGMDKSVVEQYSKRTGKLKLVESDNSLARKVFG